MSPPLPDLLSRPPLLLCCARRELHLAAGPRAGARGAGAVRGGRGALRRARAEEPRGQVVASTRDELRQRALEQLLGRAKRYRLEEKDEEAEASSQRFLAAHDKWGTRLNGALESSLIDEVQATRAHLRRIITGPRSAGLGPQRGGGAHAQAPAARAPRAGAAARGAHPERAPGRRGNLRAAAGGAPRTEAGVHWVELVSRYCRRFGPGGARARARAGAAGHAHVVRAARGREPRGAAGPAVGLARAFEASPWFAPGAARAAHARPERQHDGADGREPVRLTAAWEERVPYTYQEKKKVESQEPYEKVESTRRAGRRRRAG